MTPRRRPSSPYAPFVIAATITIPFLVVIAALMVLLGQEAPGADLALAGSLEPVALLMVGSGLAGAGLALRWIRRAGPPFSEGSRGSSARHGSRRG
jgi:hypothetical protein